MLLLAPIIIINFKYSFNSNGLCSYAISRIMFTTRIFRSTLESNTWDYSN